MWVIGGINQAFRSVHPAQELQHLLALGRDFERLGREPDVLGNVLARKPAQPWHLASQAFIVSVATPKQARQPSRSSFDEQQAQPWEFIENSVADERDEMGHHCLGPERVRLEVEIDAPAPGAGWIGPTTRASVDRDRTAGFLGCLIDWMEHWMAESIVERIVDQHDLHHTRVSGVAADLGGGLFRELTRDKDRGRQSRILR